VPWQQPNEPQLAFDTQASTDHNNSLKRTSPSARNAADFQSSYWRESAEVEQVAPPMVRFDTCSLGFDLHLFRPKERVENRNARKTVPTSTTTTVTRLINWSERGVGLPMENWKQASTQRFRPNTALLFIAPRLHRRLAYPFSRQFFTFESKRLGVR